MKKKSVLCFFLLLVIFHSCEKCNVNSSNSEVTIDSSIINALNSTAVIGDKMENPYRIDNMIAAFRSLPEETKSGISEDQIVPTHKYVQFEPSSYDDLKSLNTTIESHLYLTPLDYSVSDGWIEVDSRPEFSTNGFQHRWAVLPIDEDLSSTTCPYTILYYVFDPGSDVLSKSGIANKSEFLRNLEDVSNQLLGYDPIPSVKSTSVVPSGYVTYRDTCYHSYIGCRGMSVWANRLTKESYGHCDDSGYFECNKSFQYSWTYHVYFSRTDFEMREDDSTHEPALQFSNRHDALNLQFKNCDVSNTSALDKIFYCEILRAACTMFYYNTDGLSRPPKKSDLSDRMYIQAMRGEDPENGWYGAFYSYPNMPRPYLRVYRDNGSGQRRNSAEVYSTTIHELAHSAHWLLNNKDLSTTDTKVKETWARGVQAYLTNKLYSAYWSPQYFGNYTGLVEDLIESGYSISEIEASLSHSYTWADWEQNLYDMFPHNPSRENLSHLFEIW